jgi:hypothetical protein
MAAMAIDSLAEMVLIYQGIVHHGWRFPFI